MVIVVKKLVIFVMAIGNYLILTSCIKLTI